MWSIHYHLRTKLMRVAGVSEAESKRLIKVIDKRKPLLNYGPGILVLVLTWVWVRLVGGLPLSQGTLIDVSLHYMLSGVGVLLAIIIWMCLYLWLLDRQIDHHLFTPACFWCGYLLIGLEPKNGGIRCPECSKTSPVATKPDPTPHAPQ